MWPLIVGALLCLLATACAADNVATTAKSTDDTRPSFTCPDCELVALTGIVDGDTIDTTIGRVRFYGVDTPERGESCYEEATNLTASLVGDRVRIEDGPRLTDRFGRRLAYVFDESGASIDSKIIEAGSGIAWVQDGQHRERLIAMQAKAMSASKGCLWRLASSRPTLFQTVGRQQKWDTYRP